MILKIQELTLPIIMLNMLNNSMLGFCQRTGARAREETQKRIMLLLQMLFKINKYEINIISENSC